MTPFCLHLAVDELHDCRLASTWLTPDPEKSMMCVLLGIKPFQILWKLQKPVACLGVSRLDTDLAGVNLLEPERF